MAYKNDSFDQCLNEDNLDSIVDGYFSFINDDTSKEEISINDDTSNCGLISLECSDLFSNENTNFDSILDEHFAFLQDDFIYDVEKDQDLSLPHCDVNSGLDQILNISSSVAKNVKDFKDLKFVSSTETEPIYSNVKRDTRVAIDRNSKSSIGHIPPGTNFKISTTSDTHVDNGCIADDALLSTDCDKTVSRIPITYNGTDLYKAGTDFSIKIPVTSSLRDANINNDSNNFPVGELPTSLMTNDLKYMIGSENHDAFTEYIQDKNDFEIALEGSQQDNLAREASSIIGSTDVKLTRDNGNEPYSEYTQSQLLGDIVCNNNSEFIYQEPCLSLPDSCINTNSQENEDDIISYEGSTLESRSRLVGDHIFSTDELRNLTRPQTFNGLGLTELDEDTQNVSSSTNIIPNTFPTSLSSYSENTSLNMSGNVENAQYDKFGSNENYASSKTYPVSFGTESEWEKLRNLDLEMEMLEYSDIFLTSSVNSCKKLIPDNNNHDILPPYSSLNENTRMNKSNMHLKTGTNQDKPKSPILDEEINGERSMAKHIIEKKKNTHSLGSIKSDDASENLSVCSQDKRFNENLSVCSQDKRFSEIPGNECLVRSSPTNENTRNLSSSISGVIRRSMRRMKHMRLSGKKNKRRSEVSEETNVRRHFPSTPEIGLPTVRSPSSSAVLLPTLLSALAKDESPREVLPSPDEVIERPYIISSEHDDVVPGGLNPLSSELSQRRELSENIREPTSPTGSRSVPLGHQPTRSDGPPSTVIPSPGPRQSSHSTPSNTSRVPSPTSPASGVSSTSRSGYSGYRDRNPRDSRNSRNNHPYSNRHYGRGTRGTRHVDRNDPNERNIRNNNGHRHRRTTRTRNNNNESSNSNNHNINNNNNNNNSINNITTATDVSEYDRSVSVNSMPISRSATDSYDDLNLSNTVRIRMDLDRPRPVSSPRGRNEGSEELLSPKRSLWPHSHSGSMSVLAVTLNLFNISRFAVLGGEFGWQFFAQWLIISLLIGVPLMSFLTSAGQTVGRSTVDFWTISPVFKGIGVALLLVEVILGIYCSIPVAWLFTFFRDSFDMRRFRCYLPSSCDVPRNLTNEINNYVTGYLSINVLQRYDKSSSLLYNLGSIKFDLSFNVALIWIITFLALSRGPRSYGKVCYLIILMSLTCFFSVGFYLVYWTNHQIILKRTHDFFINRHSWMAAGREAFIVWCLHAAVLVQTGSNNKKRHVLWKDTLFVTMVTVVGLGLASVCGIIVVSVMREKGLAYSGSSFETESSGEFVKVYTSQHEAMSSEERYDIVPPTFFRPSPFYDNFYVGIRIRDEFLSIPLYRTRTAKEERSGYNVIRFITEMFPGLLFAKDEDVQAVWPPIFYLGLLFSGLAHQLAVWYSVVQGFIWLNIRLLAPWETLICFCCCLFAFSASLLMATPLGIHILYFLDYNIGCAWWIMILQLSMVLGIILVRGKPYTAQQIAKRLLGPSRCCSSAWMTGPLAFSWTIMVPVGLLVLSISSFKTGNYQEIFTWNYLYWPTWTCQVASGLQMFFLFLVPFVAVIQTCKYLVNPKWDIFERIQRLYRPPPYGRSERDYTNRSRERVNGGYEGYDLSGQSPTSDDDLDRTTRNGGGFEDPPPKYTPPPSYSTATGFGFTKNFNHSFRRLRNALRNFTQPERDDAPSHAGGSQREQPYIPPPDYIRSMSSEASNSFTFDPMRIQQILRPKGDPGWDNQTITSVSTTGSGEGVDTICCRERRLSEVASPPVSPGDSSYRRHFPLGVSRSFSKPTSDRSSRLRRTLTSSFRRSSRRYRGITRGEVNCRSRNSSICFCDAIALSSNSLAVNPSSTSSLINADLKQSEA